MHTGPWRGIIQASGSEEVQEFEWVEVQEQEMVPS